jgi:hypothetical protein
MSRATATMAWIKHLDYQRNTNASSSTSGVTRADDSEEEEEQWGNLEFSGGGDNDVRITLHASQSIVKKTTAAALPVGTRPSARFRIEDAVLPLCIHCCGGTTRRCDGGCHMPYCSLTCQSAGLQWHKNYCGRRNF